jgi:HEAT repeat protein
VEFGIPLDLLRAALIAQVLLILGLLGFVFGHWGREGLRDRYFAPRVLVARRALVSALEQGALSGEERRSLHRLPRRLQIEIFGDLAPNLGGEQRGRLTLLATDIGLIQNAERRCRSILWWRRLQGSRLLTLLGGGDAIMPRLFKDRSAEVRAQAAEWGADHPEPQVIDLLLDMLKDPRTLCRFTVQDSLLRVGGAVVDPIVTRLSHERPSLYEAVGTLKVAAGLAEPRLLEPALRLCNDDRSEVRALAAGVAGRLGGTEATDQLLHLLGDPVAEVRAAGAKGLGRLGHWRSAGPLSKCLRDEAWMVRMEASLALRNLGNPGLLILRRFLGDDDRFAADMAKMVLGLPDTAVRRGTMS